MGKITKRGQIIQVEMTINEFLFRKVPDGPYVGEIVARVARDILDEKLPEIGDVSGFKAEGNGKIVITFSIAKDAKEWAKNVLGS